MDDDVRCGTSGSKAVDKNHILHMYCRVIYVAYDLLSFLVLAFEGFTSTKTVVHLLHGSKALMGIKSLPSTFGYCILKQISNHCFFPSTDCYVFSSSSIA